MDEPFEQLAGETVDILRELAGLLLDKVYPSKRDHIVVPVVGAGASISAKLPSGQELAADILNTFTNHSNPETPIYRMLLEEAREQFTDASIIDLGALSLFKMVALISATAYGRDVIKRVLHRRLANPEHRPIAYELLAHLMKHGFIDHLLSLNFDELLDEALTDELSERFHAIEGTTDIRVLMAYQRNPPDSRESLFIKPFGSLKHETYRIKPEEVAHFGSSSVWNFLLNVFLAEATEMQKSSS